MSKWKNELPRHCDICKMALVDTFYDAKTQMGPWGILDAACFRTYGVGLGSGRGQQYDARTGEKIAG